MSDNLPPSLPCPGCGREKFKFPSEALVAAEMVGCVCAGCGRALTEEDIQKYLRSRQLERRVRVVNW